MGCDLVIFRIFLGLVGLYGGVEAKARTTDAFMSSIDLKNIFRMEMSMVEVLRKQKAQLEAGLQNIHSYTQEVDMLYQGEGCSNLQSCNEDILERIVGNPIYNYQMLKRLLVYWKSMEEEMKKIDTKRKFKMQKRFNLITGIRCNSWYSPVDYTANLYIP